MRRTSSVVALAVLVTALSTGGCVSVSTETREKPSIVHDHRIALDFTTRPTRQSFGMPKDANFQAYQRVGKMYDVTVTLPTGTFHTPAFLVQAASNAAGGVGDTDYSHPPKFYDVQAIYPSGREAIQAVLDRADVLGVSPADVDRLQGDLGAGGAVPQSRVVRGLLRDWLSIEVVFTDQDAGRVQVTYEFNLDTYHNPATDAVLREGTMHLPITARPSREQLGFLPSYDEATVQPEPGKPMTLVLDGGSGEVRLPAESVSSSAPDGTSPPSSTVVLSSGTNEEVGRALASLAPTFGIGPEQIDHALREGGSWQAAAPAYDAKITVGTSPHRTDSFAAQLKLSFTWK